MMLLAAGFAPRYPTRSLADPSMRLAVGESELSMFTTITTFGTPQDITLEELSVELFFPADDATEAILQSTRLTAVSDA